MTEISLCKNVVSGYDINGKFASLCKLEHCPYSNTPYEEWKSIFCPVNAAIGEQAKGKVF